MTDKKIGSQTEIKSKSRMVENISVPHGIEKIDINLELLNRKPGGDRHQTHRTGGKDHTTTILAL